MLRGARRVQAASSCNLSLFGMTPCLQLTGLKIHMEEKSPVGLISCFPPDFPSIAQQRYEASFGQIRITLYQNPGTGRIIPAVAHGKPAFPSSVILSGGKLYGCLLLPEGFPSIIFRFHEAGRCKDSCRRTVYRPSSRLSQIINSRPQELDRKSVV